MMPPAVPAGPEPTGGVPLAARIGGEMPDPLTLPTVRISLRHGDGPGPSCHDQPEVFFRDVTSKRYTARTAPRAECVGLAIGATNISVLSLPAGVDGWWSDPSAAYLRRRTRRAQRRGYTAQVIDPVEHEREIVRVNRSASHRQGWPMSRWHRSDTLGLSRPLWTCARHRSVWLAAFDGADTLRAYLSLTVIGDVASIEHILGDPHGFADGVMYFGLVEAVRAVTEDAPVKHVIYNMQHACSPGLTYFKERSGFRGSNVDWVLR